MSVSAQQISVDLKKAPLEQAFRQIEAQVVQRFVYTREMMDQSVPVTISAKDVSLDKLLSLLFAAQPLDWTLDEKFIKVRFKTIIGEQRIVVNGTVINDAGQPVPAATVVAVKSKQMTTTDGEGRFTLRNVIAGDDLRISSIGFADKTVIAGSGDLIRVIMEVAYSQLDETVVMAYGKTTRRFNTGNISKVSREEIEAQPVSNPLATLSGRVPGLVITQSSGVPGASFKVEIRGRTALDLTLSKNDPLFVIDGIPFEPGNTSSNLFISAANNPNSASEGGLSPLNTINPADIESIEVLKDADATAIYGSRGANGVILITTKKGKPGATALHARIYHGTGKVGRHVDMMNTQQYVEMRREAFRNDGIVPTATNAPDIMLWDTTRYTDFSKLLIGNTAHITDAQVSLTGGSELTSYLVGANYHRETTVFPGDFADVRSSINLNLNQRTSNNKLNFSISTYFSRDNNQQTAFDLSTNLRLPPNLLLFDSAGALAWQEKNVFFSAVNSFTNPLAQLLQKHQTISENLNLNFSGKWQLARGLEIKATAGYNRFLTDESSFRPKASLAPNNNTLASANFGGTSMSNWILEPQAEYTTAISKIKLQLLVGTTFQEKEFSSQTILATNYANDVLLQSVAAAGAINASNFYSQYRYTALFGRAGIQINRKYLLKISARRDGSSRFGPDRRFATFGAVGAGWLFTEENFLKNRQSLLSFGKLRGSIGYTGNDQIGDYKFYDLWTNTFLGYMGAAGLMPTGLFNPNYNWEGNLKLEGGIELGIAKDRVVVTASYYRHRSSNQLVNFNLPAQTGFATVVRNMPAVVENYGVEIGINGKVINNRIFSWNSSFNITVSRNRLKSFPGLATSPYYTSYVEGQPLTAIRRFRFMGVNPTTGVYEFEDVNGDGLYTVAADYQYLGNRQPVYFGGFSNNFKFNGLQLDLLFQFVKQRGNNYLSTFYQYTPGMAFNQPVYILDRWQKPGDIATVQAYTTQSGGALNAASMRMNVSDGIYSDASFIRLKTAFLSYQFPKSVFAHLKIDAKVFIGAQNLLTITSFAGADPENQRLFQVPPLRVITGGIQVNF